MKQPDRHDLDMIDGGLRTAIHQGMSDKVRQDSLKLATTHAQRAVHTALGDEGVAIEITTRGTDGREHRMRALDRVMMIEIAHVDITRGHPTRAVATIAMLIGHYGAMTAYNLARNLSGTAQDGGRLDGAQPLHPFGFAMEHAMGRPLPRGRETNATTGMLKPVPTDGGRTGRHVVMNNGTPDLPWADRRPTTVGIEMGVPETMVQALVGKRLCDVVSVVLPSHQQDAYDALMVAGARTAGSKARPRIDLILEPAMQVPRQPAPLPGRHPRLDEAWRNVLDACIAI